MRYLAVDLGDKRTGFAVGDPVTGVVTPAGVVSAEGEEAAVEAVLAMTDRHEPDGLVIGLPLNMDGSEGPAAARVRRLGQRIEERAQRPVEYQDERLTSYAAEQVLSGSGKTHGQKKRLRDALAAAEILKDYLEGRRS